LPADPVEPEWFTADQIERLNELLVAQTGENHVVLSRSLLEGAVARPQNLWAYEGVTDLVILAVRLLEGIGKNHCFEQGNKRTAFHAAVAFLDLNGSPVDLPDTEANAALIRDLIVGQVDASRVESVFKAAI
jgi:death-on-curing protein